MLTVRSVEPEVISGDATVDVVGCHTRPGVPRIGASRGRLDSYCVSHEAPEGARLGRGDDLVLKQVTGPTVRVQFGQETVREHLRQG